MTRPPLLDDDENDETPDDEGGPDRVVEADGPAYDVAFEILDMVSLYGSTYALGYPVTDGEFGTARAALVAAYSRRQTPSAGRTMAAREQPFCNLNHCGASRSVWSAGG